MSWAVINTDDDRLLAFTVGLKNGQHFSIVIDKPPGGMEIGKAVNSSVMLVNEREPDERHTGSEE